MVQARATLEVERLRLGGAVFLWKGGQLWDARGAVVPLRAKSLKMFAALLSERGSVLSKDKLSELVWPRSVATDESIARCIADIRKALGDDGHEIVETFPKQGYRLNAEEVEEGRGALRSGWAIPGLVGAAALALAAVGLMAVMQPADVPVLPSAPATAPTAEARRNVVAILPFTTTSEEDGFLAAGLSDDLEIHLAEMSGIRIISQAQTVAVAKDGESPVDLATSLGARFVVHGGVRQSGDMVALAVSLIDGDDGTTLWADRYEGGRDGLMRYRDALPDALVDAMSIELSAQDKARLAVQDTQDPLAFEEVMHARRELGHFTYDGSLAAERHLRRAIERDPGYARAYAELASVFAIRMENDWIVLSSADTDKAFYFAERALEIDPDLWFTHYTLGRLHSVSAEGDTGEALRHLHRAMELQPANDDARMYYAIVKMMAGDVAQALEIIDSVLATHPSPPFWYFLGAGNANFHLERFEEAHQAINRCLAQMASSPYCLRTHIAVLARLGRIEDAQWAVEEYAILGYDTTIDGLMKSAIERDETMRQRWREAYALIGLE